MKQICLPLALAVFTLAPALQACSRDLLPLPSHAAPLQGDRSWATDYSHLISVPVSNYDSDCNPWLTPDEDEIFFIRASGHAGPADDEFEGIWDIYHAEWDEVEGTWGPVSNLGPNVNSENADRSPTTTADGDTLLFHSGNFIFCSIRIGGEFQESQLIQNGTDPCLSLDGRTLYYALDKDIWVCSRGPSGAIDDWVDHQELGPNINSLKAEVRPFISQNDSLLFFSDFSNPRPGGYGDADIWVSEWVEGDWGPAENIGAPLNMDRPLCSTWVSSDLNRFYGASESYEGSAGTEDIWISYLDSIVEPELVIASPGVWVQLGELEGAWNVYDMAEDASGMLFAATAPSARVNRSSDAGESWEACAELPGAMIAHSLLNTSAGDLLVGTYPFGDIFLSSDQGDTWTLSSNLPTATAVRALYELSDGRILAGTSPECLLFHSLDGGSNWSLLSPLSSLKNGVTVLFESSNGLLMAGGWGNPMVSINGGNHWNTLYTFSGMASIEAFLETPGDTLWMSGWGHNEMGFAKFSTDLGINWQDSGDIGHGQIHAVRVYDIEQFDDSSLIVGYQPGPDSVACRSWDGGQNWENLPPLEGAHEILRFFETSAGDLLACTTPNGDIFRYNPEAVAVPGEPGDHPFAVSGLIGGFPNPFRESTRLSWRIAEDGPVELSVLDVRGRRVARLLQESLPEGYHELEWNGRDQEGNRVAAGVYFLRMKSHDTVSYQKVLHLR